MNWRKSEIYQTLEKLSLKDFDYAKNLDLKEGGEKIGSISFDSRKVIPSDCFVAIKGPKFDGHDYVNQAYLHGAKIAIVEKKIDCPIEQIEVQDTLKALHQLALHWRRKFDIPIVAITGSNGKTSTKHILSNILGKKAPTLSTYENFNNEFGIPITLFNLAEKHQYAVIEIGSTKLKDVELLIQLVLPEIAIVTNINETHLKSFKTIENISISKSEIYSDLNSTGVGVVNLDDPYADLFIEKINQTGARVISFSNKSLVADIAASQVIVSANYLKFSLKYGSQNTLIQTTKLLGSHNLSNILAACAACYVLKIPITTIKSALEDIESPDSRLQKIGSNDRICLIDDSYNANPAATYQAIELLDMHKEPKIMVLGDMFDLGEKSEYHHRNIGKILNNSEINHILLLGEKVEFVAEVCPRAKYFSKIERLKMYLKSILAETKEQHTVLIKGSRAMKMERIVHYLKDQYL